MENRNIRVVLSYDGTDFCGWQSQASGRTAQDVVEAALAKLHDHPVQARVAGRTDSGVHAEGQVINFHTDSSVPALKFVPALNQHLPADLRALHSEQVALDFDARYDARVRVYKYYIESGSVPRAPGRRYSWVLPWRIDAAAVNRYAASVVGTHDFTTFAAAGDTSASRVRDVYSASFYVEGRHLVFKIAANAFLYRMVRSLVGTMVELERRRAPREEMARRLSAGDRAAAGQTAPPWGLFLHKVLYDERSLY